MARHGSTQLSSMLCLLLMHALLLIWASTVVVGVYFKVDTLGEFVSLNDALEVYGHVNGPDAYSLLQNEHAPTAHVRIASHTADAEDVEVRANANARPHSTPLASTNRPPLLCLPGLPSFLPLAPPPHSCMPPCLP